MSKDEAKNRVYQTVLTDKIFSEKIYSGDPSPERYSEKFSLQIHKDECNEFNSTGQLCLNENCFNEHFIERLEAFSYSDREKFVALQVGLRNDKLKFLEELRRFLYDCQDLFEPHIYEHYLQILNNQRRSINKELGIANSEHELGDKVFIIHGHDVELKKAVQLFITRIGLDDVVLHECPNRGRTIIGKLIEESKGACFAIALFSPDDKLEDGTMRARQNVILEMGYFIGLMGNERVRILKKGNTEIPSDLQGVLYEPYDENGAWRINLAKEMQDVGIEIDLEKLMKKF